MAGGEFGTGKSLVVIAIVVGCFAILWPKIFYPMMQAAFQMTSPDLEGEQPTFRPRDRPPHNKAGMSPHVMAFQEAYADGVQIKEGRPFPHPSTRQPSKPQSKSGGAMSIIMPIYTIGIVVFFLYTILKLVFKKPSDAEKKPLIKDFHMDPDYHKFVCQQPLAEGRKTAVKPKTPKPEATVKPETSIFEKKNVEFDEKDYEIYQLRKKLEETESAMERIMKHMGAVSETLSKTCLLKEGSTHLEEKKKITHEILTSDTLLKLCKSISKSTGKRKIKKGLFKQPESMDADDVTTKEATSTEHNFECDQAACKNEDNNVDDPSLQQQLKRDSSINSEGSSFEILSQSISSAGVAISSSGSDTSDEEENVEEACLEEDIPKNVEEDSDIGIKEQSSDVEEVDDEVDEEDIDEEDDDDEYSDEEDSEHSKATSESEDP